MSELSNLPSQKDAIAAALALYPTRPFAVSDIGSQSGWLKASGHDARNLYVSGPMGLATSIALGLAAVRPDEQVLAIAGDGALAMKEMREKGMGFVEISQELNRRDIKTKTGKSWNRKLACDYYKRTKARQST